MRLFWRRPLHHGFAFATLLAVSLLLWIFSVQVDVEADAARAVAAATAILVGAVVCCAAAIAGDNMQDLKAGTLVGATPYKQQIMQIVGVLAAALSIPFILEPSGFVQSALGVAVFAGFAVWLYRVASRP